VHYTDLNYFGKSRGVSFYSIRMSCNNVWALVNQTITQTLQNIREHLMTHTYIQMWRESKMK